MRINNIIAFLFSSLNLVILVKQRSEGLLLSGDFSLSSRSSTRDQWLKKRLEKYIKFERNLNITAHQVKISFYEDPIVEKKKHETVYTMIYILPYFFFLLCMNINLFCLYRYPSLLYPLTNSSKHQDSITYRWFRM
jgi:hypothetical protein